MKTLMHTTWVILVLTLPQTVMSQPLQSSASEPASPSELIVLLAAEDAPSPEGVVEGIRKGRGLDADFLMGQPSSARLALTHRARGEALRRLQADPDSPRARLERYVVIRYPEHANLEAIMHSLEARPDVLHVERNLTFRLSAISLPTNDDLVDEQWGLEILNLPAAWERTAGHAFLGFVDTGLQIDHPDLRTFSLPEERSILGDDGMVKTVCGYASGSYEGGNFRPQLSKDFGENDCNVDELDHSNPASHVGHGTHVAGIAAATTDNDLGVAGACPHCSLMMAKVTEGNASNTAQIVSGLSFLVDEGVQVISLSWQLGTDDCTSSSFGILCDAIAHAESRDVVITASAGNRKQDINFPARDFRVMSIGGLEPDGDLWDFEDEAEDPDCPFPDNSNECGSNFDQGNGATQALVAPAVSVLSTMYEGRTWSTDIVCGDDTHPSIGYGFCTGTSMSAPYAAAIAGLVRSANPLLTKTSVEDALITMASRASYDPRLGYGIPDAVASIDRFLGNVAGQTLANRLTPLFTLYSPDARSHFYTNAPQMASAAINDLETVFLSGSSVISAPPTPGYAKFPDCRVGPCPEPHASVYVFTSQREPWPGAPALVPLYRMSFDEPCTVEGCNNDLKNRSFFYTTETSGVEVGKQIGYELDGIEGYIFSRCEPEPDCIPMGATRLYRLYNLAKDDYAIFPESQEQQLRDAGYVSQSGFKDWIGYVYPNVDTDGDTIIDGFETVAGTYSRTADSDFDGVSDGQEMGQYPPSDPCTDGCEPSFADVPPTHWAFEQIETIFRQGFTSGCGRNPRIYCPTDDVTRGQMAVFIVRGMHGASFVPSAPTGVFSDVSLTSPFARFIEQIYRDGITAGCGKNPLRYCPNDSVTRAQMAVFLVKATHAPGFVPPKPTGIFSDVNLSSGFARFIEEAYRDGIIGGCETNPLRYCPGDLVTRDQMAVFLVSAFDL